MKPNKRFAAVAAAALAMAGMATVAAPSAQAYGPTALNLGCWINGISSSIAPWNGADHTLTVTPTPYTAGTTKTISYSFSAGPNNGGPTATQSVTATFAVSLPGGTSTVTSNTVLLGSVANGTASPGATLTANLPLGAGTGAASVSVENLKFTTAEFPTVFVDCNANTAGPGNPQTSPTAFATEAFTVVAGPTAPITSVTGQAGGVTAFARGGNTLNVAGGVNWAASQAIGSFTASLCDASGANCDAAATNTLQTSVGAVLSGTVTVPPSPTAGARTLKVVQGASTSLTSLTILGARSISLDPSFSPTFPVTITVTGSNWNPGGLFGAPVQIQFRGYKAGGAVPGNETTDAPVTVTMVAGSSTFSQSYTITDPLTASIGAAALPPNGSPATDNASASFSSVQDNCTVPAPADGTVSCQTTQFLNAQINAGTLSQQAFAVAGNPDTTNVRLGAVAGISSPLTATAMTGNINRVVVTDNRGGILGWTLSASLTGPFTEGGGGSIAESNLTITPGCASIAPGSASGANPPATAQTFGAGQVTLCTKDGTPNLAGSTGGQYEVTGALSLNVPAFQKPGSYQTVMVVTLA